MLDRWRATVSRGGTGIDPTAVDEPEWRPLQLMFALMILRAFLDPTEIVDLFFFSSGGGKT